MLSDLLIDEVNYKCKLSHVLVQHLLLQGLSQKTNSFPSQELGMLTYPPGSSSPMHTTAHHVAPPFSPYMQCQTYRTPGMMSAMTPSRNIPYPISTAPPSSVMLNSKSDDVFTSSALPSPSLGYSAYVRSFIPKSSSQCSTPTSVHSLATRTRDSSDGSSSYRGITRTQSQSSTSFRALLDQQNEPSSKALQQKQFSQRQYLRPDVLHENFRHMSFTESTGSSSTLPSPRWTLGSNHWSSDSISSAPLAQEKVSSSMSLYPDFHRTQSPYLQSRPASFFERSPRNFDPLFYQESIKTSQSPHVQQQELQFTQHKMATRHTIANPVPTLLPINSVFTDLLSNNNVQDRSDTQPSFPFPLPL
jgi:hypothetical protein